MRKIIKIIFVALLSIGVIQNKKSVISSAAGVSSITLNADSAVFPAKDNGNEFTFTVDGIQFGSKFLGEGSNYLDIYGNGNGGVIYNITPFPKKILSITINQTTTVASTPKIHVGNSRLINDIMYNVVLGGTLLGYGGSSTSQTLPVTGDYTHFGIKAENSSNLAVPVTINSIVINYESDAPEFDTFTNIKLVYDKNLEDITLNNSTGIRFRANFTDVENASDVDAGVILLPKYILELSAYSTIIEAYEANYNEISDVKANSRVVSGTNLTFAAVLTNIPSSAYEKEVVGCAYYFNGEENVYSNPKIESLSSIAQKTYISLKNSLTEDEITALKLIKSDIDVSVEFGADPFFGTATTGVTNVGVALYYDATENGIDVLPSQVSFTTTGNATISAYNAGTQTYNFRATQTGTYVITLKVTSSVGVEITCEQTHTIVVSSSGLNGVQAIYPNNFQGRPDGDGAIPYFTVGKNFTQFKEPNGNAGDLHAIGTPNAKWGGVALTTFETSFKINLLNSGDIYWSLFTGSIGSDAFCYDFMIVRGNGNIEVLNGNKTRTTVSIAGGLQNRWVEVYFLRTALTSTTFDLEFKYRAVGTEEWTSGVNLSNVTLSTGNGNAGSGLTHTYFHAGNSNFIMKDLYIGSKRV